MPADPIPPQQPRRDPAPPVSLQPDAAPGAAPQETTKAEEWGERYDNAKGIARGGKETGRVPGAPPDRG